jgi:hypothetical protein
VIVLFALAQKRVEQHIDPAFSGILSQNFQGPVGNARAFFSLPCAGSFRAVRWFEFAVADA